MGAAPWMVERLPVLPRVPGQTGGTFYGMWAKGGKSGTPLQSTKGLRLAQL